MHVHLFFMTFLPPLGAGLPFGIVSTIYVCLSKTMHVIPALVSIATSGSDSELSKEGWEGKHPPIISTTTEKKEGGG